MSRRISLLNHHLTISSHQRSRICIPNAQLQQHSLTLTTAWPSRPPTGRKSRFLAPICRARECPLHRYARDFVMAQSFIYIYILTTENLREMQQLHLTAVQKSHQVTAIAISLYTDDQVSMVVADLDMAAASSSASGAATNAFRNLRTIPQQTHIRTTSQRTHLPTPGTTLSQSTRYRSHRISRHSSGKSSTEVDIRME